MISLDEHTVSSFHQHGHVHCSGLLPAQTVASWHAPIAEAVRHYNTEQRPLAERDTYHKAFLQTVNLWRRDEAVAQITRDDRLAAAAAQLQGVSAVQLYHDQALFKEAGGGGTPWHVDQYYWPMATDRSITAWIPLQDVSMDMGPLAFASGSQHLEACRHLAISDESHRAVAAMLHSAGLKTSVRPYALGDVSFHRGWTYHCAGPNRSTHCRAVMTVIYMDAAMRLAAPAHEAQSNDRASYCPDIAVGEVIASPLNPILGGRTALA
jgi:ectoine hydroxylase-related dioxygenase (phytanoyl-CoA dioxygenase family)